MMQYKGSLKHKNRPGGAFGTICPEWSHQAGSTAFGVDIDAHPWQQSTAQELLDGSIDGYDGKRYATSNGVAFAAQPTNDGTWHGYPLPWNDVPRHVQRQFLEAKLVDRRAIRRQVVGQGDRRWALSSDDDGE